MNDKVLAPARQLALCAVLCFPAIAAAQMEAETETNFGLRASGLYTDNLGRDRFQEEAGAGSVGMILGINRDTPHTNLNLNGEVDYLSYTSDRFDDEAVGTVDASAMYRVAPGLFHWSIDNHFGQVRRDLGRPSGPGNREHRNIFSTGPQLFLPLGRRTQLQSSARYEDRRFENSTRLDSQLVSAQTGISRELSRTRELGAFASARRIEFDGANTEPFNVFNVFGSWNQEMRNGSFELQAGVNSLRVAGTTRNGVLVRFNLGYELTPRSSISMRASREFEDVASSRRTNRLVDFFDGVDEIPLSSNALTRTNVGGRYSLTRPRLEFSAGLALTDEAFEREVTGDRRSLRGDSRLLWRFSPVTTGELDVQYRVESFRQAGFRSYDVRARAGLTRDFGRQLSAGLEYRHFRRFGGQGTEFRENSVRVSLTYWPLRSGTAEGRRNNTY